MVSESIIPKFLSDAFIFVVDGLCPEQPTRLWAIPRRRVPITTDAVVDIDAFVDAFGEMEETLAEREASLLRRRSLCGSLVGSKGSPRLLPNIGQSGWTLAQRLASHFESRVLYTDQVQKYVHALALLLVLAICKGIPDFLLLLGIVQPVKPIQARSKIPDKQLVLPTNQHQAHAGGSHVHVYRVSPPNEAKNHTHCGLSTFL